MAGKPKVLFTSHTANFSKFNRPFMRWFKEQGYEVHYASAGEEVVLDCDVHHTISFERSPFKLNNLRAIKQLKKIIDCEQYSIIHTHTPMGSVVTRLAARQARQRGARVIYTAHGFHFFTGAPLLSWMIYYPIEKIMARYTDTLIAINQEDYRRAQKKFYTDVRYIPGVGVDPDKFDLKITRQEKNRLRRALGITPDDFVVIYPAELSKRKNQIELIQVLEGFIKQHPDVHIILPGADSLNGKLHSLVKSMEMADQVHLIGYRSDIPQLMKVSNLAVSSSRQEGLAVNIMEAMISGLPAVATNIRGHADVVKDGESGILVHLSDLSGLAEAVARLYKSPKYIIIMGQNAKKQSSDFLLETVLEKMTVVYNIESQSI